MATKKNELLKLKKMLEENEIPFHWLHCKTINETINQICEDYHYIYYPNEDNPIFVLYDQSESITQDSALSIYDDIHHTALYKGTSTAANKKFTAEEAFEIIKSHY